MPQSGASQARPDGDYDVMPLELFFDLTYLFGD